MRNHFEMREAGLPTYDYLSQRQLETLLRYVRDKADEARRKGATRAIVNELVVSLLARAGLLARELCNLNIGDLPKSHGENTIWIRDAGANVTRKVDIDSETIACLNKFVKLYRQGAGPGDPLFESERGGRLSYMSLYSKIKVIGRKAGIGKLYPQMLRHTYLVRLYDATGDLRLVQLQAGHAHCATTARYSTDGGQTTRTGLSSGDSMAGSDNRSSSPDLVERTMNVTPVSSASASGHMNDKCEACGKPVSVRSATRIDSGQLLCPGCLQEIRTK